MATTRFYFDETNTCTIPHGATLNGGMHITVAKTATCTSTVVPAIKPARPNLKPGRQNVTTNVKWLQVNVPGCVAQVDAVGNIKGYLLFEDCRHGQMKRIEGFFSPMSFETDGKLRNMIPTAKELDRKCYFSGSAVFYWYDTNGDEHCGCRISKTIKQTWYVEGDKQ